VITDKIIKGAGSHRILIAVAERPRTSRELRKLVGAVNSTSRFDGEYMKRLEVNGFVIQDNSFWMITKKGREKLETLKIVNVKDKAAPRTYTFFKPYTPEKNFVRRSGSLDLMNAPSRVGPTLYYRDGRTEKAK
jgi:predicted transcriptional regulator